MTGYQNRMRLPVDVLAESSRAAADRTEVEKRPVQGADVLMRATIFGVRAIRACPRCTARIDCDIHYPPLADAGPPAKKEPKRAAAKRYAEAYAAGQIDAMIELGEERSTARFSPPIDSSGLYFLPMMATGHARGTDGAPLTGDTLVAWFRGISREYRLSMNGSPFEVGFCPRRCMTWLQGGRKPWEGSGKPVGTRQKAPKGQPSWKADEGMRFT